MPIHDYVNVDDSEDILKDQFFKSYKDVPTIIKKDDKKYHKVLSSGGFQIKGFNYSNGYS